MELLHNACESKKAIILLSIVFFFFGCKKLVDVNPPVTSTSEETVFTSDATAIAVLTDLYAKLSQGTPANGNLGVSLLLGLSSDELTLFKGISSTDLKTFYYTNKLYSNATGSAGIELWNFYYYIYICNSAIEGLNTANTLTPAVKQQLLGEAGFIRAFSYFYLLNLFGNVPLEINSDYSVNATLSQSSKSNVYSQIITDLKTAQGELSNDYLDGTLLNSTNEKVRPNKYVATALLARVYLYMDDWADAETQSTSVIDSSNLYSLDTLNGAFLKNSDEAIWQLQPVNEGWNTEDAKVFIIPSTGPSSLFPVYLSNNLLNSFESNDQRRIKWIDSIIIAGRTYYYPYKYKSAKLNDPVTEYLTVLRLGEMYLIRAEARAEQGKLNGANSALNDLNKIRERAILPDYSGSQDQTSLINAILHERQVELFTEWGHRWLDLKRTGNINTAMDSIDIQKGSTWQSYQGMYPIPFGDIQKDPNLTQNAMY